MSFSTFSILPPRIWIAFFPCVISSSTVPVLYGIKQPPTFTNGIQYSESTAIFATARETTKSYFSRISLSLAPSSARPCTADISFKFNASITSCRNLIRLFRESNNVTCRFGNAIFNGIPGNPAPVPTSIILYGFSHSFTYPASARLSIKCFRITSSRSVIAVRFITLFFSISIS